MACSVDDAAALVQAARASATPLASYSPVRWVPDIERLVEQLPTIGAIQSVTVTGPADPDSEYGGIFFYGIHCADVAQRLAPGELGKVAVERSGETVIASYRAGQ